MDHNIVNNHNIANNHNIVDNRNIVDGFINSFTTPAMIKIYLWVFLIIFIAFLIKLLTPKFKGKAGEAAVGVLRWECCCSDWIKRSTA